MRRDEKDRRGFTLVEIMLVLVILGMLEYFPATARQEAPQGKEASP